MDVLDLTRLQFAVVTIYHYFFVPLSISLAATAAGLQIAWLRTRRDQYLHLTKFVGKLLIVTFAVGVVTGLVQEFQFGLGWSAFANFYGDVFGPTLAIEGMLAFFLEATFLALWYFGWDRLPRLVHTACIVIVAVGTLLSAFIILAANSFMQNPVAYALDPVTGRARLTSFTELMLNKVNLAAFPHTMAGALMVGGALLLALGVWRLIADPAYGVLARLGAWLTLAGGGFTALTGDHLGKVITEVQPMKMAAAEALYETTSGAPFAVFATGKPLPEFALEIPWLLSILAKGNPNATVQGIDDLQAQYAAEFGPGSYVPMIPVAFWTFRLMIGAGMLAMLVAGFYLWRTRRGRTAPTWLTRWLPLIPLLPAAANTFGWIFTETARQPWIAFGISKVADGISPGLTSSEVVVSLAGFTVVYGVLAVVWLRLVRHLARRPLTPAAASPSADEPDLAPVY
ncbi:cytochrome ubiquinol oxidase subunit I [Paractinoplanes brasiliensis]|uniref:Cytochrome d ubiquinol oxidase subunit I n=1 Tax=Paractinoplanes brasiliensis TaxID=52695 RepID=A0A4R6K158_9ACTN|nr:cytochrome ubiquinol oxidase subunit I [Actinoplanes brasiliensis]TDO42497.1 cytochrome d ubiquinol oxidase subunit I [Actinoplanes brasiliensis]GID31400.1 cytochrome ubiquinol oxidase subunit I [Actinoplanes brasiliensis]